MAMLHDIETEDEGIIINIDKIGNIFTPERTHGSIIKQAPKLQMHRRIPNRFYVLTDDEVQIIYDVLIK